MNLELNLVQALLLIAETGFCFVLLWMSFGLIPTTGTDAVSLEDDFERMT